jgi:hypothetical protein
MQKKNPPCVVRPPTARDLLRDIRGALESI